MKKSSFHYYSTMLAVAALPASVVADGHVVGDDVIAAQRAALASGFSMGSMFLMATGSLCCILYQGGVTVKRQAMKHGGKSQGFQFCSLIHQGTF